MDKCWNDVEEHDAENVEIGGRRAVDSEAVAYSGTAVMTNEDYGDGVVVRDQSAKTGEESIAGTAFVV